MNNNNKNAIKNSLQKSTSNDEMPKAYSVFVSFVCIDTNTLSVLLLNCVPNTLPKNKTKISRPKIPEREMKLL